ncbi:MAG: hypothetical protein J0H99_09965, partial [Rhodospirillales bacterium]|nr:hypothetical protein [Rhodospirillales bacterium]
MVGIAGGLALPLAAAVPGLLLRFGAWEVPAVAAALGFSGAVVGAAFLLTWGAELAELDIGEGLALALLALIAVLPEYAVDVIFAWKAGRDPAQYAPLALANMTGANRLLIGAGWSVVALVAIAALRRRHDARGESSPPPDAVALREVQVVELAFLALASAYALTLPLRATLTLLDGAILFGLFAAYLWRLRAVEARADPAEMDEA